MMVSYFGWVAVLATVIVVISHVVKTLLNLIEEKAENLQHVSTEEANEAVLLALGKQVCFLYQRPVMTSCSVVLFCALLYVGVDGYSAYGLAFLLFAGMLLYSFLKQSVPVTQPSTEPVALKEETT